MDPVNEVHIPRLPPGLTRIVVGDGTVCLMDSSTLWIPTGISADLSQDLPGTTTDLSPNLLGTTAIYADLSPDLPGTLADLSSNLPGTTAIYADRSPDLPGTTTDLSPNLPWTTAIYADRSPDLPGTLADLSPNLPGTTGISTDLFPHLPGTELSENQPMMPFLMPIPNNPINLESQSLAANSPVNNIIAEHESLTPETSAKLFSSPFHHKSRTELELGQIRPEILSCVFPGRDQPQPPPILHQEQTVGLGSASCNKASTTSQDFPRSELRPRATNLHQAHKYRKPLPESVPLFEPQPLGAQHVKNMRRPLGHKITKSFSGREDTATLTYPWSTTSQSLTTRNENQFKNGQTVFDSDQTILDSDMPRSTSASQSNTSDEYAVEYLYLTKLILRKKTKTAPSQSAHQMPCKRKSHVESNCKGLTLSAGKFARVEARDVIDEMELLRAVESLDGVSWNIPSV